jgi:GAF domain-containing protein
MSKRRDGLLSERREARTMSTDTRETRLNAAFVKLADTLIDDYDIVELLHTLVEECTAIFDVQAGGLMLADADGELQLIASTSEKADLVEVMQLDAGHGPCVDCFATGKAVAIPDIANSGDRWPEFRTEALKQGFHSINATPLRLRGQTIGTLNLFSTRVGDMSDRDILAAQALSDVATIGILQERLIKERGVVADQLQRALDSRVLIEQAKGVLSEYASINVDDAFGVMRSYARSNNMRLHDVAEGVVGRAIVIAPRATHADGVANT